MAPGPADLRTAADLLPGLPAGGARWSTISTTAKRDWSLRQVHDSVLVPWIGSPESASVSGRAGIVARVLPHHLGRRSVWPAKPVIGGTPYGQHRSSRSPAKSLTPAATRPSRSRWASTTGPLPGPRSPPVPRPGRSKPSERRDGDSARYGGKGCSGRRAPRSRTRSRPEVLGFDAVRAAPGRSGNDRPRRHAQQEHAWVPTPSWASPWPWRGPLRTPPICRCSATSVARAPTCFRCR